ncbi:MAG: hypothetical protein M1817_000613 [Caeruleum heppii]|nr:MAG: hypothetical protein M1817_000613 [Caeruleum heppii]
MGDFKLSASLEGHEDDVRSVTFPSPTLLVSASRDATVRKWRLLSPSPPSYDASISSHGSAFVNAVTYSPPSPDYPDGLIISGGKETIIDVRPPSKSPDDEAEALLLGHSNNVCALDVDPTNTHIVSGAWDGQARIWRIGKWECDTVLEGHEGSVWAVLALSPDTVITGCADRLLRVFDVAGKLQRTLEGHKDVVRALCRMPSDHPSGADFASAGNDGIIMLWTLQGQRVAELHGHDSFIYALDQLPTGELVSSGEDRTLRIWRGTTCVQTITHPAISVWGVAVCAENGDIVSGASDRIVRVFSRDPKRQAELAVSQAFEESVKASAIPQQQVGDVNKEKLPGPEFLQQKSGTKEGQVAMIREPNGNVTAHQWSTATQEWINVGTVVDGAGSTGRKAEYLGNDYDYVFDVDVEEGKPPLKLPYNLSENPYEAATKFIQNNELPMTYLDQVANFITTNAQGATLGQTQASAPQGADPWGTESRYRPGEATTGQPSPPQTIARPNVLPQTTYLAISSANLKTIQRKIEELNHQLLAEGNKDISLNPSEISHLAALVARLDQPASAATQSSSEMRSGIDLVIKMITSWPPAQRLPGIDLLRLIAGASSALASYNTGRGETIIDVLARSGVFTEWDRSNHVMLAVRGLGNLFQTDEGRRLVTSAFDQILALSFPSTPTSDDATRSNRNIQIALATLLINFAVLLRSTSSSASSSQRALTLLPLVTNLLSTATDSEAAYRALVALGTILHRGDRNTSAGGDDDTDNLDAEEIQEAARDVYDVLAVLRTVETRFGEPRVKGVVGEIRQVVG